MTRTHRSAGNVGRVLLALSCALAGGACSSAPGPVNERAVRDGAVAPDEPFALRVWRAGRAISPSLTAARAAELEAQAGQARAALRGGRAARIEAELGELLAAPDTSDELWSAAASVAAGLELYALSDALAPALDTAPGARAVAAAGALHALYGRWFTSAEALAPYRQSIEAGEGTRLLLESNAWEETRSRERLLADLAHSPSSAGPWLADPDPRVRCGAARVLAQVFERAEGDADAALDLLVTHLETEFEPCAFHECLVACLAPLERAEPGRASLERLRSHLLAVVCSAPDPRATSAAEGLARLPWRAQGAPATDHVLFGVDTLGEALLRSARADRMRGAHDPDTVVVLFDALRILCDVAVGSGLAPELRTSRARESTLSILRDPTQAEAARAAAAAAFGPLGGLDDGRELAAVLRDPTAVPSVQHALLGSLRPLLASFQPDAACAEADELLAAMAELTGAEDADLRRRALSLCADPRLEPWIARLDPTFLVERLESEVRPEGTADLLKLVQRFGRPDMLGPLVSLERFDRIAADPALLSELGGALKALCKGNARGAIGAARRVVDAPSEEASPARLRLGLELIAELDPAAVFELYPKEHGAVCLWAWKVHLSGAPLRDAVPEGLAFERRLLEEHLPRAERGESVGLTAFQAAHLEALVRADLFLGGIGRGTKQQAEAAFESASALAVTDGLQLLVLRDRARFRAAANEGLRAMADYRRLLDAPGDLLGMPDLRTAVELLARLSEPTGPGRTASSGEACDLRVRMVSSTAWRSEPASVRMQDLRDLASTALASRDPDRLARVAQALADLPLTQAEPEASGTEPAPLWKGLTRDPVWFQELLDLRSRVRTGLRELEAQG